MALERTLSIIKPDAVEKHKAGGDPGPPRAGGLRRPGDEAHPPDPRRGRGLLRRAPGPRLLRRALRLHVAEPHHRDGPRARGRGGEVPRGDRRHRPGQGRRGHDPQALRRATSARTPSTAPTSRRPPRARSPTSSPGTRWRPHLDARPPTPSPSRAATSATASPSSSTSSRSSRRGGWARGCSRARVPEVLAGCAPLRAALARAGRGARAPSSRAIRRASRPRAGCSPTRPRASTSSRAALAATRGAGRSTPGSASRSRPSSAASRASSRGWCGSSTCSARR